MRTGYDVINVTAEGRLFKLISTISQILYVLQKTLNLLGGMYGGDLQQL